MFTEIYKEWYQLKYGVGCVTLQWTAAPMDDSWPWWGYLLCILTGIATWALVAGGHYAVLERRPDTENADDVFESCLWPITMWSSLGHWTVGSWIKHRENTRAAKERAKCK